MEVTFDELIHKLLCNIMQMLVKGKNTCQNYINPKQYMFLANDNEDSNPKSQKSLLLC